jgi:hypothetical protein
MAQLTEAACLLQSGALYPLRRGYLAPNGDAIFIGLKPGAFSIYFDDSPIYHFDLEGRWQRAFVEGRHYLKGLDARVQALDRIREGENLILHRSTLNDAETAELDGRIRTTALDLLASIGSSLASVDAPEGMETLSDDQTHALLGRAAEWDADAWAAYRNLYAETYGPLPFLPPEAASPVVLQATIGQSRGTGFGGAGAVGYLERSPSEFLDHARAVSRLLGRRLSQSRQLFLAGADALRREPAAILADLDAAASVFPIGESRSRPRARDLDVLNDSGNLDGIQAFLHEFDRPVFSAETWEELRCRRFTRLILGLESGSAEVRRLYGRDWTNESFREWAASCGVGLGLVVVVGAGGIVGAAGHVEATVDLVGSLAPPPGTLVSLVDADELETRPLIERGFEPLDEAATSAQRAELKARISAALGPRKVKVTTYSTEKRRL